MNINSSPWLRFCAGAAILLIALGVTLCVITPCMYGVARIIEALSH